MGNLKNKRIKLTKKFLYKEYIVNKKMPGLSDSLKAINKHVWTPHSMGAIKERNYKIEHLLKVEEVKD